MSINSWQLALFYSALRRGAMSINSWQLALFYFAPRRGAMSVETVYLSNRTP